MDNYGGEGEYGWDTSDRMVRTACIVNVARESADRHTIQGSGDEGAGHKNAQEEHKEGERERGVESEQEDGEQAEQ
jgi:hypothetical protein